MKDFPFDPYDFFGYLSIGLVVLIGLEVVVGVPRILGQELRPLDLTVIILAAYIAGQLAATPAKWFLEDTVVRRLLQTPSINLMRDPTKRPILRFLFPGYFNPLPASIQQMILTKARAEGLTDLFGETLFLHVRFRDYIRSDVVLMKRLDSFLNNYGFSRNLCFVALLFSISVLITTPFNLSTDLTLYAIISGFTAVLLFYRYLKFYRQYTYELFNTYGGKS